MIIRCYALTRGVITPSRTSSSLSPKSIKNQRSCAVAFTPRTRQKALRSPRTARSENFAPNYQAPVSVGPSLFYKSKYAKRGIIEPCNLSETDSNIFSVFVDFRRIRFKSGFSPRHAT